MDRGNSDEMDTGQEAEEGTEMMMEQALRQAVRDQATVLLPLHFKVNPLCMKRDLLQG